MMSDDKWGALIWVSVATLASSAMLVAWIMATLRQRRAERRIRQLNVDLEQRVLDRTAQLHDEIAERQRAEVAMQDSEARYRSLFEDSPISLWEEDFSAVKQRIDALRQQGVADFAAYFNEHPDVVAECVALVSVTDVNHTTLKMYGAASKTDLLANLTRIVPPESYDVFRQQLVHIAEGRKVIEWEGVNLTLTGERLNVRLHWTPAPGYEQGLTKVFISIEDVTARKQAEEALRGSEERYRLITENVSDTVWLMDMNLKIAFISPSVVTRRGYTLAELHALPFEQHLTPNSLAQALPMFAQMMTPDNLAHTDRYPSHTLELEFHRKDGSTFWNEATFTLIRDDRGRPAGILGVGRDVTPRKQRERELEALVTMAASLRAAPTHGDMLPLIVNQVQQLLKADGASLVMRHPTTNELIIVLGRGAWSGWTGLRLQADHSVSGQVMATGRPYLNNDARTDSNFALVDRLDDIRAVACAPLATPEAIVGVVWIGRRSDIVDSDLQLLIGISEIAASALYRAGLVETLEQRVADRTRELTAANRRLQELDRLKDEFVSNVSHELRTPLANIKLYLGLLERGKPDKHAEYLHTLRRETTRLEEMIGDLLDLSRLDLGVTKIQPVPVDLNQLLRQLVADRVNLALEQRLSLDYQPAPDLPRALIDPPVLTQVVSNLITNAINYTPRNGSIVVTTALQPDQAGFAGRPRGVAEHDEDPPGISQWITFTVRDSGPGIAAKDRLHLFERFYRGEVGRKASAAGTGLGLAISKEIVERLGGHIAVESEPGHGAAFTVWLRPAE